MSTNSGNGKDKHVRLFEKSLSEITPSLENDELYRPIDWADPEIVALADSIAEYGVKEPLVITEDDYILSGHRRFVAAILAGLHTVPCFVEPIKRRDDLDKFIKLLREYNRQRVKSFDEALREEAIDLNPEVCYQNLLKHRRKRNKAISGAIEIEGVKVRKKISAAKQPMLDAVLAIIESYREFWPLSDRTIHYPLLNDPPLRHAKKPDSRYANDRKSYNDLCDLLTRARLDGQIDWEAIADTTRPVTTWDVSPNVQSFLGTELEQFGLSYARNLMQSQASHIELLGEKNTLAGVIEPVARQYCIPLTLGRGYCSLPPRHDMAQRFKKSGKDRLVILILSDFDPEGEDIGHSFVRSMRDDFYVHAIKALKVGLTADQVQQYDLPPVMSVKSPQRGRAKQFIDKHGQNVWELEALQPGILQQTLRDAIDSVIDVKAFNRELDHEKQDAVQVGGMRHQLKTMLQGHSTPHNPAGGGA